VGKLRSNSQGALYWRQLAAEMLAGEKEAVARFRTRLSKESLQSRNDAQAETLHQLLGDWEARVAQLGNENA
jgi:hypothetical protein